MRGFEADRRHSKTLGAQALSPGVTDVRGKQEGNWLLEKSEAKRENYLGSTEVQHVGADTYVQALDSLWDWRVHHWV